MSSVVLVMLAFSAFGGEVAQDEARDAVRGWAALQEALTGKERFSADGVAKVETYQGRDGRGSFHVVSFKGGGFAERIPEVDAAKSVVTGCSRLGKTALLAAARDERFAVCVPVQTGGGGCPLAKRDFGENVSTEMKSFPHWYCKAYGKYVDNE